MAANLKAQTNAAVKIADQGAASATAQTEFEALAAVFRAAEEAGERVLNAAQSIREMALRPWIRTNQRP